MKTFTTFLTAIFILVVILLKAQTNDFYDDAETIKLRTSGVEILVEIANPGKVNLETLTPHSVIVKETLLQDGKVKFTGAYRYDGFSLYDILNSVILKKKNEIESPPYPAVFYGRGGVFFL